MASNLSKRLAKLEEALAQRTQGPKVVRRVILQDGEPIPEEGADELLIVRRIVSPPERPADEPLATPSEPSTPIERGDRTRLDIQQQDESRFHRRIEYPKCGIV
jgi:hypothetical protein